MPIEFLDAKAHFLSLQHLFRVVGPIVPFNDLVQVPFQLIVLVQEVLGYYVQKFLLVGFGRRGESILLNLELPIADVYLFTDAANGFDVKVHVPVF